MPVGRLSCAEVGVPPSPEYPGLLFPAKVEITYCPLADRHTSPSTIPLKRESIFFQFRRAARQLWFRQSATGRFQSRFIRLAAYPAPKPLSIFTTVTLLAQLFSIPSSAARPWKLAPYPTLVGTAITGTETSPPMTLGSAPSMPAQTTTTRAWDRRSRLLIRR